MRGGFYSKTIVGFSRAGLELYIPGIGIKAVAIYRPAYFRESKPCLKRLIPSRSVSMDAE